MSRPTPDRRSDYNHFLIIPTRWADNDVYGHINNSVYYFYFDTVVNRFLIDTGLLVIGQSQTIGLVVETGCNFFAPMAFPDMVTAGLRVGHIGSSSVRYEIGLFKSEDMTASAQGHFVHVYVDDDTRKPARLSDAFRDELSPLRVA